MGVASCAENCARAHGLDVPESGMTHRPPSPWVQLHWLQGSHHFSVLGSGTGSTECFSHVMTQFGDHSPLGGACVYACMV